LYVTGENVAACHIYKIIYSEQTASADDGRKLLI